MQNLKCFYEYLLGKVFIEKRFAENLLENTFIEKKNRDGTCWIFILSSLELEEEFSLMLCC
jgi:hypothetical protein